MESREGYKGLICLVGQFGQLHVCLHGLDVGILEAEDFRLACIQKSLFGDKRHTWRWQGGTGLHWKMCQLLGRGLCRCQSACEPVPTIPQLAEYIFESISKPPALERKSQEFHEG